MISFVSLMWAAAAFFAFTGALRGWRREVIGASAALLGSFALLQFDSLLRGSVYLLLSDELTFLLQMAVFLTIVIRAYRSELASRQANDAGKIRSALGGAAVGFFNGYVIAGAAWYFLDINRYPFPQLLSAPADGSASFQGLGSMPMLLLGGGDLLALVVLVILAIIVLIL